MLRFRADASGRMVNGPLSDGDPPRYMPGAGSLRISGVSKLQPISRPQLRYVSPFRRGLFSVVPLDDDGLAVMMVVMVEHPVVVTAPLDNDRSG